MEIVKIRIMLIELKLALKTKNEFSIQLNIEANKFAIIHKVLEPIISRCPTRIKKIWVPC